MPIRLKGKVVLITGASSGFGEDSARLFAAEGACVIMAARRIERMQDQVARIQATGGEAMAVSMDVNNRADIDNMVQSVIKNYKRIDILFNNAGFGRLGRFDQLDSIRDIKTQVSVNLIGLMEVTHAVLPHMISQHGGHIINMSSVAGWVATPMYSVYAATKFGVRGFTDGLRREVRMHGIRVSGIYPGPALTEFGQHTGISNFKTPAWTHMTSQYVARRVVDTAKHPRRSLIIPWWLKPVVWAETTFPGGVDWVIDQFVVNKYRKH